MYPCGQLWLPFSLSQGNFNPLCSACVDSYKGLRKVQGHSPSTLNTAGYYRRSKPNSISKVIIDRYTYLYSAQCDWPWTWYLQYLSCSECKCTFCFTVRNKSVSNAFLAILPSTIVGILGCRTRFLPHLFFFLHTAATHLALRFKISTWT